MYVVERIQKLLNTIHKEEQHKLLFFSCIGWLFLWSIFYVFKYNEGNLAGDLVHNVTTAINRVNPEVFAKDYLYHDPSVLAYYSPQQIWSIGYLYLLTGSISWSLGILQFFYSTIAVFGAWLVARELSRNVWLVLMIIIIILQFVSVPLNGGHTWGFLKGIFPAYFPYNALLARGLLLIFLALVIQNKENSSATIQSAILGFIFTVHAPTGLTLTIGAVPYFLWRWYILPQKIVIFRWIAAFLVGSSFFLLNYWLTKTNQGVFSSQENSFLYDFVQYRFPEDYPAPMWKLLLRSSDRWGWITHVALVSISIIGIWGIVSKKAHIVLLGIGMLLIYIFGYHAIPLAILFFYVLRRLDNEELSCPLIAWKLAIIVYGAFFVCTWLQWASDLYYASRRLPPFIIDNARFLPVLFAFCFVIFVSITTRMRQQAWLIMVYGIATIPLILLSWDPTYHEYAKSHDIKWRAQFDFDPNFALSEADNKQIIEFAKTTPPDSVFLYDSTNQDGWYFRLRARRSISVNANDLGIKYYSKKFELIKDWSVYIEILQAYREKNTQHLCDVLKVMDVDYIVFPKVDKNNLSCLINVLDLESGAVYMQRKPTILP